MRADRGLLLVLTLVAVALLTGCSGPPVPSSQARSSHARASQAPSSGTPTPTVPGSTPVQTWLTHRPLYVAHRGGDANWTEGTAYAYRQAAAWSPEVALEVPVWRTSDGVWVVSEQRSTGRVFGADRDIPSTPWSVLSRLRTRVGDQPMARLREDVLDVYGRSRILFIDDKRDTDATAFLDLLSSYAGRTRYIVKSFWASDATASAARRRGYLTWGYYFDGAMPHFAATQQHFDLLGLPSSASAADFRRMLATGKPLIAHIIETPGQAQDALAKGATGLMVADVEAVVPAGG